MEAFLIRIPSGQASTWLKDATAFQQLVRTPESLRCERLELGETWPGLHFVLTGEVPISSLEAHKAGISWDENSLENALLGGHEVPAGAGWGPARYVEPERVTRLAQKLSAISVESFRKEYDADYLEEEQIPPGGWADLPEALDELTERFRHLVGFYQRAATAHEGVLICTI